MADQSASSPAPGVPDLAVPWPRVEAFVAKLAHDIRNGFNALELQITLIGELSDDPEIKEEIKRVRQSLAGLTASFKPYAWLRASHRRIFFLIRQAISLRICVSVFRNGTTRQRHGCNGCQTPLAVNLSVLTLSRR